MLTVDAPDPLDGAALRKQLAAAGVVVDVADVTLERGELHFTTLDDSYRETVERVIAAHGGQPTAETVEHRTREVNLKEAISVLRQWSEDAEATTVIQGNAIQVLNVVVDRLGVFFDRFADLLENRR